MSAAKKLKNLYETDIAVIAQTAYKYSRLDAAEETGLNPDLFPEEMPFTL